MSPSIPVPGSSAPFTSSVVFPLCLHLCLRLLYYAYVGSFAAPFVSASAIFVPRLRLLWLVRAFYGLSASSVTHLLFVCLGYLLCLHSLYLVRSVCISIYICYAVLVLSCPLLCLRVRLLCLCFVFVFCSSSAICVPGLSTPFTFSVPRPLHLHLRLLYLYLCLRLLLIISALLVFFYYFYVISLNKGHLR